MEGGEEGERMGEEGNGKRRRIWKGKEKRRTELKIDLKNGRV